MKPENLTVFLWLCVNYKLFFSLEVSDPNLCRLDIVATQVYFKYSELTLCETFQPGQTLCQDVRGTEYGEESAVCIYVIYAFSFSLKYIDLGKKHYFNIQAFVNKDILRLDRQYAKN